MSEENKRALTVEVPEGYEFAGKAVVELIQLKDTEPNPKLQVRIPLMKRHLSQQEMAAAIKKGLAKEPALPIKPPENTTTVEVELPDGFVRDDRPLKVDKMFNFRGEVSALSINLPIVRKAPAVKPAEESPKPIQLVVGRWYELSNGQRAECRPVSKAHSGVGDVEINGFWFRKNSHIGNLVTVVREIEPLVTGVRAVGLQLKVDCYYKRRDGETVGPARRNASCTYPWVLANGDGFSLYTDDGYFNDSKAIDLRDLIEEVLDATDTHHPFDSYQEFAEAATARWFRAKADPNRFLRPDNFSNDNVTFGNLTVSYGTLLRDYEIVLFDTDGQVFSTEPAGKRI